MPITRFCPRPLRIFHSPPPSSLPPRRALCTSYSPAQIPFASPTTANAGAPPSLHRTAHAGPPNQYTNSPRSYPHSKAPCHPRYRSSITPALSTSLSLAPALLGNQTQPPNRSSNRPSPIAPKSYPVRPRKNNRKAHGLKAHRRTYPSCSLARPLGISRMFPPPPFS